MMLYGYGVSILYIYICSIYHLNIKFIWVFLLDVLHLDGIYVGLWIIDLEIPSVYKHVYINNKTCVNNSTNKNGPDV